MKAALFLCLVIGIISEHVSAKPTQPVAEPHHHKRMNCLLLTPEKERQIELVVQRLTEFLNQLTAEMDLIDLRVINLEVDEHDHEDSSETVLQLTVNDCVRKEFDPEEFYGTDIAETKDKTGDVTQKPVEDYTDRPDVAVLTNTEDQNEPSDTETPEESTTSTPVATTAEVVVITEVPVTTTMQTVPDAEPVTTAVAETDTTTTEPVVTTSNSTTTEKNDDKDQIVTSDTSTADDIANFERPREMNNVYVDYIDYETDLPISSSEENSYNEIEETPDSNDDTTKPTGDLTDQNTNKNDAEPPVSYNKRAVTGNDEEIINDNPTDSSSYEYEDIPDSTEPSSEYKDSSELPEDSNADDEPQTPTTDNYSIITTPVDDAKNDTNIDNGTGDKENNTINQTTTSTTEIPNIQPVTAHPDDGPTTEVSQFDGNPTSTSSNTDNQEASTENDENYNDDYDLESSEYDDIDDSTESNEDVDESDTEDQVEKSGSEVEETTTSTIPQENIASTESDEDTSNVIPELVYLNLANNGWVFIDDIRKQKGITSPPIVILQDTPKGKQMPKKRISDVTTTGVSKSSTSVSTTETNTATSDRSPSKLYYLHLPGAGQQYLKERSKTKGDSPTLVYVESVQPNQTTYVFVD